MPSRGDAAGEIRQQRKTSGFCDGRKTQIHRVNRGKYHFVSGVVADYFRSGLGVAGLMLSQNDHVALSGRPDRVRLRAIDRNANSPVEAGSRAARGLTHAYLMCGFQESPTVFGWMKTIGRRRPNSGDAIASDGFSPWRLRLTIWRGAQAPHGRPVSAPADCKLVGRWRIVEATSHEGYFTLLGR
jgi:hypothetical protein